MEGICLLSVQITQVFGLQRKLLKSDMPQQGAFKDHKDKDDLILFGIRGPDATTKESKIVGTTLGY